MGRAITNLADLRRLRVRRLADLVRSALGEADGEEAHDVAVGRLKGKGGDVIT